MRRNVARTLLFALVFGGWSGVPALPARAHEFWLAPSRYIAHAGDTIRVSAFSGMGFRGETRPFAPQRVVRLFAVGDTSAAFTKGAVEGDSIFATFVPRDGGGTLIAYESNAASIELPNVEFDEYLAEEGLAAVLALRRTDGNNRDAQRERYARCAKTWVSGPSWQRASEVMGLTLELVPLSDPSRAQELTLRVLFRGRPLAGALVRAWRQPLAHSGDSRGQAPRASVRVETESRSDRSGMVRLLIAGKGEWLLSCVHMEPSEDPAISEWQSWWASFTFGRQAGSPSR